MGANAITLRQVTNFLRGEYLGAFRHDHWNLGIVDAPIQAFLESGFRPDVHWLPRPPRGKYHSDPFGLTRDGTTAILFEDFDFGTNKGVISSVQETPDGGFSPPRVAIELPFH